MIELGGYVRDILKLNEDSRNFRVFGPDETMSNRLNAAFEATNRDWNAETLPTDEFLSQRTAASWTPCCPSICARAGWKAIC